jgi:hypothetical protein
MTLRNAPLSGQDAASRTVDLPDGASEIFLSPGLDSQMSDLPVGQKSIDLSVVARRDAAAARPYS